MPSSCYYQQHTVMDVCFWFQSSGFPLKDSVSVVLVLRPSREPSLSWRADQPPVLSISKSDLHLPGVTPHIHVIEYRTTVVVCESTLEKYNTFKALVGKTVTIMLWLYTTY